MPTAVSDNITVLCMPTAVSDNITVLCMPTAVSDNITVLCMPTTVSDNKQCCACSPQFLMISSIMHAHRSF